MEKENDFNVQFNKVDTYKGHNVYTHNFVPKESVAKMDPAGGIMLNPEAFEILKNKPDYLERIYKHEIEAGAIHDAHECEDKDILFYLRDNGYDFGDFKFE